MGIFGCAATEASDPVRLRGLLRPAWVVEEETGEQRALTLEDGRECSARNMRGHILVERERQLNAVRFVMSMSSIPARH